MTGPAKFPDRGSKTDVETGLVFQPEFDDNGLIVCVTTDHVTGDVLMVGYMNAASLRKTLETGEAWYWSRSRRELWRKGATSGQTQSVREIRTDCDQDALLLKVAVGGNGGTCHVGYRSCFFRIVDRTPDAEGTVRLVQTDRPL